MKKPTDFLSNLGILIKDHWKAWAKETKKYRKKEDSLNFIEKEEYNDLMDDYNKLICFFWITFPFKAAFYMALFSIVMIYAFDINLVNPFIVIISEIFKLYPLFLILFALELFFSSYNYNKRRKEVLDYLK